jgi:hypothetical protein
MGHARVQRSRVRIAGAVAGLLLVAGVLGACSKAQDKFSNVSAEVTSSSDSGGSSGGGSDAADTARVATGAALPKGANVGSQVADDRDVIYTGTLTVRVTDAEQAAADARDLADAAGGYLASSDAELEGDRQVKVTLRFPAEDFDEVMADVAELGHVDGSKIDSKDVTDQVVDLQGHLENAQTSAKRLRELLAEAQDVQHVIAIEDRLTQREVEIESITGQLEVLQDQVDLATVRATFTEKEQAAVSDDLPGPLAALRAGGVAVVNIGAFAIAAAAFALPFIPFALLAWWLVRRWRRNRLPAPPVQPVA